MTDQGNRTPLDAASALARNKATVLAFIEEAVNQGDLDAARMHFQRREARLERQRVQREGELAARKAAVDATAGPVNPVLAALARAKAKQQEPKP